MDLKSMSDEELSEHRVEVLREHERRENLARIPEQISELAKLYVDGGGSSGDLISSIDSEPESA